MEVMMANLKIDVYKQHFTVKSSTYDYLLEAVCNRLISYRFEWDYRSKRTVRKEDKYFFVKDIRKKLYRFPIGVLRDTILTLGMRGITKDEIVLRNHGYDITPVNIGMSVNKSFTLRDYQVRAVDEIVNRSSLPTSLLLLMTGYGKSLISMAAMAKLNFRFGMILLPKFIDKWLIDLKKYTDLTDGDITVIQGSDSLRKIMFNNDISSKVIVFSSRTLSNYFSNYETFGEVFDYPTAPDELMEHLKIGCMVSDETHLEFHVTFRAMLYFNVYHMLGMTATLYSKDGRTEYLYSLLYPDSSRIKDVVKIEPHIDVYAINYRFTTMKGIRYKRSQGYSHILYEQSIMLRSRLLKSYLDMINYYTQYGYIHRKQPGQKCLIFCASVELCSIVANYLAERYPKLDIRTYTQDDDYKNVLEADITVSTILSSGTAIDIPGLITSINTIAIDSKNSNAQTFGRLRKIDGVDTRYYYLYNSSIDVHRRYHKNRTDLLRPISKSYNYEYYPQELVN